VRAAGAPAWAAALALLGLAACAGTPPPHGAPPRARTSPSGEPAPVLRPNPPVAPRLTLADLPGWAEEDHASAFAAFQQGCGASREVPMRQACADARRMGALDDRAARRFFEARFRPAPLTGEGVLTAYFAPEYDARRVPDAEFSAPVRPRPPSDAMAVAAGGAGASASCAPATADDADPIGALLGGPPAADGCATDAPWRGAAAAQPLASADRTAIEASPARDALAWMRPEDLFFLQIQGSGVLDFPDGRRMKAVYAGDNGRPFTAIARPMAARGLLAPTRVSAEAIRGWLRDHAGPAADAVMRLNPRYVFFALRPDDGREPAGAAGVPLPAGRAIAVDPSRHGYGELYWIDAEAPVLTGAAKRYRRLAISLDTGSAIRGEVRADLYMGRGPEAGREAGLVRHTLRLVRLIPVGDG
jgi:membrane-bound lytic murein transglycosylase A